MIKNYSCFQSHIFSFNKTLQQKHAITKSFLFKTFEYKVVFIGDTGVGKSTVATRYIEGVFRSNVQPTISASYLRKNYSLDNRAIQFQIWDTAGQEKFRAIAPLYYRNAHAVVLMYDLTSKESFMGISSWLAELRQKFQGRAQMPHIYVVGNKKDIYDAEQHLDLENGREFAASHGLKIFFTSAVTGQGVNELFAEIASDLLAISLDLQKQQQLSPLILESSKPQKSGCC